MAIPNQIEGELLISIANYLTNYCEQFEEDISFTAYTNIGDLNNPVSGSLIYANTKAVHKNSFEYDFTLEMMVIDINKFEAIRKAGNWLGFMRDYAIRNLAENGVAITVNNETVKVMKNCTITYCHYPKSVINQDDGWKVFIEIGFAWISGGIMHPQAYM